MGEDRTGEPQANHERLTVAQAAALGITEGAVRSRIKPGTQPTAKEGATVYVLLGGATSRANQTPNTGVPGDQSELIASLQDQIRYLREQLDAERQARTEERRRHDTVVAQLASKIPAIEAPQEASVAAEAAEEQQGRVRAPFRCPRCSGGGTEALVEEGVRKVNLSQRRLIVVFLVVLLFVAAGLMVGSRERTNTPLGQPRDGVRGGPSTANSPTSLALLLGLSGPVVAAVAIVATNRREAMRLEHERWSRMRDKRREAYIAFMAVCDRLHGGDQSPEARAELRKTLAVVELVSLSEEVKDSVRVLTNHLIIRDLRVDNEAISMRDEAAYRVQLKKFTKAIQRDLGITPAAMQNPA